MSKRHIGPTIEISDEAGEHLLGFAESFVAPPFVERWKWILVEKPARAFGNLVRFDRQHHPSRCRLVRGRELDRFLQDQGSREAIVFDGYSSPHTTSLSRAYQTGHDAVFSITPDKQAVFIYHEGWIWDCRRLTRIIHETP